MRPGPLATVALLAVPIGTAAQDVEMLGARYGTPVPAAYYQAVRSDATAFRFNRGRPMRVRARMEAAARVRAPAASGAAGSDFALSLGPREGPVEGVITVPVLLGRFADSSLPGPFTRQEIQDAYFGASGHTVRTYFQEVSGGRVDFQGHVQDWTPGDSLHTRRWVTGGSSGLTGRTGLFIRGLLEGLEGVDWGAYDNDGPDGVPNSGDDDGFVDALAVIHPTAGAECGGEDSPNRIWSHKWSLSASGAPWATSTPGAGGGVIRIDDYFVQPALSCTTAGLNEIGVFTHEAGHAFGLPDLYDTDLSDGNHQGAGNWELMASGGWGCDNLTPSIPCHLGAWSKVVLGWADVVEVGRDSPTRHVALPPVESGGTIYRVGASDGSGEYFLLENRQRLGFDATLKGVGLLVWQIDPDFVTRYWPSNLVNASEHMGVWLRQADGLDQLSLSGGGRGDAGDPFPYGDGLGENRDFHATTTPASVPFGGGYTGVTLTDIRRSGTDIRFDLLSRLTRVRVSAEGAGAGSQLFTANGVPLAGGGEVRSAPFAPLTLEAAPGASVGPGARRSFQGWSDGEGERSRTVVTPTEDVAFSARYDGLQLELAMALTGGVDGIVPATFVTDPNAEDLWFDAGSTVTIEARPRTGFEFRSWTGALAGRPNPATVTMDTPLSAGAAFELVYAVTSAEGTIEAARPQEVRLVAENANPPVSWSILSGDLPRGVGFDPAGRLHGSAMETGTFALIVRGVDAIGLTGEADVLLRVDEPALGIAQLAAPFLLVGAPPTDDQKRFLDLHGDADGRYDLGDFRAWILDHPGLPMSTAPRSMVMEPVSLRIPMGARREEVR